jgi:hypothetical protein
LVALAAQIGVAAVLVLALYIAACARAVKRDVRAGREDIQRLHGALEVLALLVMQRAEPPSTAAPVDVGPVEQSSQDDEPEEPSDP